MTRNGKFRVGVQEYDVVIVPNLRTVRTTTMKFLETLAAGNGQIIVAGSDASLVDVEPSKRPRNLLACRVPFTELEILKELEGVRDLRIVLDTGIPADSLLYQMRADGEERYLFICNTDRVKPRQCRVDIRGQWSITLLDTLSGISYSFETSRSGDWTRFNHVFDGCGSILLRLSPVTNIILLPTFKSPAWRVSHELVDCTTSLSEPNVLLLDIASHCINDEVEWEAPEEILRIDNIAREKLGLRLKKDAFTQPWMTNKSTPTNTLSLQFSLQSSIDIKGARLALENAHTTNITFNGKTISSRPDGYWADESISTIPLPSFSAGAHELVLTVPFGPSTNLERVYLLGDFGVELRGRKATIVPSYLEKQTIGDYTRQGLPFYAGNVHYDFNLRVKGSRKQHTAIQVPRFAAPLLAVQLDGKDVGKIAFQPHVLDLGELAAGDYRLRVTAYGNRDHAFGAVHLPDGLTKWYGPDAFRTSGGWWSYEYTIREMGLLTAVRVMTVVEKVAAESGWDRGSIKGYL
jgi:hypothetical protein